MSRSIVVVCHSNQPWLGRCLESALAEAEEVVLVDNGSPGEAASAVGRRLGATVVRLPANAGFPAAVNRGLERAGGDIVALLNDDAWCDPGWLDSAEKILADPAVAAVGPKVLFARPYAEIRLDEEPHFAPGDPRPLGRCLHRVTVDGTEVPLAGLFGEGLHRLEEGVGPDGVPGQWRWSTGDGPIHVPVPGLETPVKVLVDGDPVPVVASVHRINNAGSYLSTHGHGGDYGFLADPGPPGGRFDQPAERFAITGAAMVARAETFHRLGGLAESFFAYYEDTDWCWRARLADLTIRYEPAGVVHHVGGASTGGPFSAAVRFLAARNRIRMLARNAPLAVLKAQLRSPVDRPSSMFLPLCGAVSQGMVERRRLARLWVMNPRAVWSSWAGRDETW